MADNAQQIPCMGQAIPNEALPTQTSALDSLPLPTAPVSVHDATSTSADDQATRQLAEEESLVEPIQPAELPQLGETAHSAESGETAQSVEAAQSVATAQPDETQSTETPQPAMATSSTETTSQTTVGEYPTSQPDQAEEDKMDVDTNPGSAQQPPDAAPVDKLEDAAAGPVHEHSQLPSQSEGTIVESNTDMDMGSPLDAPGSPNVADALQAVLDNQFLSTTVAHTPVPSSDQDAPIVQDAPPTSQDSPIMQAGRDTVEMTDAVETANPVDTEEEGGPAEWEEDSSPYESSSESDSSDDSDDSDEEIADLSNGGVAALARQMMLMEEDEDASGKDFSMPVRSKNEISDDVLPRPDVTIRPETKIERLGDIEFIVEKTAVINSCWKDTERIIDRGSVLCKEDRTVIGALTDVLGNVKDPKYTVRFTSDDEIRDLGLQVGSSIFFSVEHVEHAFLQQIKKFKGADTSNLYDEEAGDEDMEFSDDEKEAEFKRMRKMKKQEERAARQGGQPDQESGRGGSRGGRGGERGRRGGDRGGRGGDRGGRGGRGARGGRGGHDQQSWHRSQYTDLDSVAGPSGRGFRQDDEDGPYKPLPRPSTFAYGVGDGGSSLPPKPVTTEAQNRAIEEHERRDGQRGGREQFHGNPNHDRRDGHRGDRGHFQDRQNQRGRHGNDNRFRGGQDGNNPPPRIDYPPVHPPPAAGQWTVPPPNAFPPIPPPNQMPVFPPPPSSAVFSFGQPWGQPQGAQSPYQQPAPYSPATPGPSSSWAQPQAPAPAWPGVPAAGPPAPTGYMAAAFNGGAQYGQYHHQPPQPLQNPGQQQQQPPPPPNPYQAAQAYQQYWAQHGQ